jgi:hypothetical protein
MFTDEETRRHCKGHSSQRSLRSKNRWSSRSPSSKRRRSPSSSKGSSVRAVVPFQNHPSHEMRSGQEKRVSTALVSLCWSLDLPWMTMIWGRQQTLRAQFRGTSMMIATTKRKDQCHWQNPICALLWGEGQALAQYVQQNLRIPRRGEIGYTAEAKGTRTTKRGQGGCRQLRIVVAT